jgi:hypothetical protein
VLAIAIDREEHMKSHEEIMEILEGGGFHRSAQTIL